MRYLYIYMLGAVSYGALEIAFRGQTHWSMLLAGGLCLTAIYAVSRRRKASLWQLCLAGGGIITGVEPAVGLVVNRLLGWNVWDYGDVPGNFLGQICPLYTALWVLLTVPALGLCRLADRQIFQKGRERDGCAVHKGPPARG